MLLIVSLVIIAISAVKCDFFTKKEDLQAFLSTLEQYTFTRNEVVFLLDESDSIGAANYLEVKNFANLLVRYLSVTKEHTRVAIVPFATTPRTMVDYIIDSDGKNMCSLVKSIEELDYVAGGSTCTSLAMGRAKEILAHARPNANKIIVLLSDGQSNAGYSPIAAATKLKQEGVIIFSVGVAGENQMAMEAVATSKEHNYILKKFDYIKELNMYLRKASNDSSWDRAKDDSLCNQCESQTDCCDDHAACYCGTIGGSYECLCDAGYQGKTGLKFGCSACPRGTYKIKKGNSYCEKCPPHSTTLNEASISREDCVCEVGHEKHGIECKQIRCNKLQMKSNLLVKPEKCANESRSYRSVCQYYCAGGYSLVSQFGNFDGKKECLANKTWSGEHLKITCAAISPPSIVCPTSIQNTTEDSKGIRFVEWKVPVAKDNFFLYEILLLLYSLYF